MWFPVAVQWVCLPLVEWGKWKQRMSEVVALHLCLKLRERDPSSAFVFRHQLECKYLGIKSSMEHDGSSCEFKCNYYRQGSMYARSKMLLLIAVNRSNIKFGMQNELPCFTVAHTWCRVIRAVLIVILKIRQAKKGSKHSSKYLFMGLIRNWHLRLNAYEGLCVVVWIQGQEMLWLLLLLCGHESEASNLC